MRGASVYCPPMRHFAWLIIALSVSALAALPLRVQAAALPARIITRAQWGADESLLIKTDRKEAFEDDLSVGDNGNISTRIQECITARKKYPAEFSVARTINENSDGKPYRWPMTFSSKVRLIAVHHTALEVQGDERTPLERVRALYTYHASKMGWGDIGYNFIIDEEGKIYEGRAGGDFVVGGHAYCGNISTMGIALMGNFDLEKPPQAQLLSLKWLIDYLAKKYRINLKEKVSFHGESLPAVVGHGDISHTLCPGYYLSSMLTQIRAQIIAGKMGAPILYPPNRTYTDRTSERKQTRVEKVTTVTQSMFIPSGQTELVVRPGGQASFTILFRAGSAKVPRRARIAQVDRSHDRIALWQTIDGKDVVVQRELFSPKDLKPDETATLHLRVQVPSQTRSYEIQIDGLVYTLRVEGRRIRVPSGTPSASSGALLPGAGVFRLAEYDVPPPPPDLSAKPIIRIRLSYAESFASIYSDGGLTLNGKLIGDRSFSLYRDGSACAAEVGGLRSAANILRIDPNGGVMTITNWTRSANRFRGIIECRVIDDSLVLINEIGLEDYLKGLIEEPDSEPYEKQRAFAVAARSYAAYYISPLHRKFVGKPYDGDDSPAHFQAYAGVHAEESNPRWVQAVDSTKNKVLLVDGEVIKAPYFSSDDGRTRSPSEIGWAHFPFEDVFVSKPDPWCEGMSMNGHGVGMSGCGSKAQAKKGKKAEEILKYYYSGVTIGEFGK
ncbi:TPA: hypothetical protein DCL30_00125 [Candidatus Peribacteria bacterium]|nr:hypothetical protein [Candidatus Peribacteria bacterium]HAS34696.1 hypothetical protein [Candidatus Peribacteria bacterium]